ncbi:transglycosylase domain-containing protein [Modestobacter sp. VKM Ac-2983]|uniref:transglycosylase domain-containing protein n=1 Tax=Modestobacter sp. VKM Ac-2983 TaxID=3004137 RepID=UPI0022AB9C96|nr:transglycosylase domain-containing protein [Modestobacter sp. VKM Ac-2983]MCZ2804138.1 transglycosylase domain-containing protein [Modestobacter sp. VKM Ac-2983]
MAHVPPDRRPTARFRRPADGPPAGTAYPSDPFPPYGDDRYGLPPDAGWYPPPPAEEHSRPQRRWRRGGRADGSPPQAPEPRPGRPWRGRRRGALRTLGRLVAVVFVLQALVLVSLRWVDPPTTAFMAANPAGSIQQSVPVEHVSRNFLAAVIAHEDAPLPYRSGAFEWDDLMARAEAHLRGEDDPFGSTIPQQVAKNLFLNQELSAWRKAVEAGLAAELALVVDDRRMLELYVNHAQFGPTLYGVCAASWYYFDTPPDTLHPHQAVQLAGLLPSPGHVRRAPGGGLDFEVEDGLGWFSRSHVVNAQNRLPRHLDRLGFQPVEDAGVTGLAADEPDSDDDCSERPAAVAELIAAEGTA